MTYQKEMMDWNRKFYILSFLLERFKSDKEEVICRMRAITSG